MKHKKRVKHPKGIKHKHRWVNVRNYLLAVVILIFLYFLIFQSGLIRKDCGDDLSCFNTKAFSCKAAQVDTLINNNIYEFTIIGPSANTCVIQGTMKQMAVGTPQDIVAKLEGREMLCRIPRSILKERSIVDINNVIDHCSGPLKEGLYEVLLDKMYSLIVQNLGDVIQDVREEALQAN